MGTLISILVSLGAVALSIGLTHVADRVEQDKANKNNLNSSQVLSDIYYALDEIRAKSSLAYNKAVADLERMPFIQAYGSLKAYLGSITKEKRNKVLSAKEVLDKVENAASGYQTEVTNYANQVNSWKNSPAGKQAYKSIMSRADNLAQTVEQNLGEINNVQES